MIEFNSLLINFIIYIFLLLPLIILLFVKEIFINRKSILCGLAISFIIESILSAIIYSFGHNIFSIFTNNTGVINFSIFVSKIVFIDSSLYGIKILIPTYLFKNNKKIVILVLTKITTSLALSIIFYFIFPFTYFLYVFPSCDIIYYIVLIMLFYKSQI